MLNRARDSARQLKEQVESCSELERTYFSRRSAREQLRTRVELLRRQVVEQEAMEEEGRLGSGRRVIGRGESKRVDWGGAEEVGRERGRLGRRRRVREGRRRE